MLGTEAEILAQIDALKAQLELSKLEKMNAALSAQIQAAATAPTTPAPRPPPDGGGGGGSGGSDRSSFGELSHSLATKMAALAAAVSCELDGATATVAVTATILSPPS